MLLLSLVALPAAAAPQAVGKITFARGSNAAQQAGEAPRVLGKDAEVYQGDNIQTAERSFVIIEFVDGAKVTVRPNSNFSIDEYQLQSATPQAKLALYKGGVRAESGEIAKQSPESFQIKTEEATVKAQQADYSVRVCNGDCEEEKPEDKLQQSKGQATTEQAIVQTNSTSSVVARVADIKGDVYADNKTDKDVKERKLTLGAPLYSEDTVHSKKDSYVLMVFRDGEKITLQADSEMSIADYHYQQQGEKNRSLYRLTTGGMRVLTGSIGKTNKEAFAVDTPVGTIGIRGTGFDLSCVGSCLNSHSHIQKQDLQKGQAEGLYSHVWQGEISITNDAGEFVVSLQGSNYVANRGSEAIELKGLPDQLINNPFPRPDQDRSNLQKLFSAVAQKGAAQGVYVAVHRGHVQLAKNTLGAGEHTKIDLGKGEVAHAGQKELVRLDAQRDFQEQDPYLANGDNKQQQQHHQGVYSGLLDGNDTGTDDGNYQCTNE